MELINWRRAFENKDKNKAYLLKGINEYRLLHPNDKKMYEELGVIYNCLKIYYNDEKYLYIPKDAFNGKYRVSDKPINNANIIKLPLQKNNQIFDKLNISFGELYKIKINDIIHELNYEEIIIILSIKESIEEKGFNSISILPQIYQNPRNIIAIPLVPRKKSIKEYVYKYTGYDDFNFAMYGYIDDTFFIFPFDEEDFHVEDLISVSRILGLNFTEL